MGIRTYKYSQINISRQEFIFRNHEIRNAERAKKGKGLSRAVTLWSHILYFLRHYSALTTARANPLSNLLINLLPIEQFQMVHFIADPLLTCWKGQSELGVRMDSKRAVQRNDPIAKSAITKVADLLAGRCRDRETLHAFR